MATPATDQLALDAVRRAFSSCRRPAHFTDHLHCDECADHDRTLLERTSETVTLADIGNPGWDPICFITPEGFAYYLPGLARLSIEASGYGPQFFLHLISDGPRNARFKHCSPDQRMAVADFLRYFIDTRADELDEECAADNAFRALEIWSGDEGA
jgi:hypothetical protein